MPHNLEVCKEFANVAHSGPGVIAVDLDVSTIAMVVAIVLMEIVCAIPATQAMHAKLCARISVPPMVCALVVLVNVILAFLDPIVTLPVSVQRLKLVNAAIKENAIDQPPPVSVSQVLLAQVVLFRINVAVVVDQMVVVPTAVVIVILAMMAIIANTSQHAPKIAIIMAFATLPSVFASLDFRVMLVNKSQLIPLVHQIALAKEFAKMGNASAAMA